MSEPELSYEELHPAVQRMISRRAFLRRGMQGAAALAVFGGAFAIAGCGGGDSDEAAATTAPPPAETGAAAVPLYDRLGGEDAITAVVATFLGKVAADERINAFFANTDLDRLQTLVVEQIGEASGGPQTYTGRDMKAAHAGLNITAEDFNAFVEDLVTSLNELKVPQQEQNELLAVLGPMQSDIVTA